MYNKALLLETENKYYTCKYDHMYKDILYNERYPNLMMEFLKRLLKMNIYDVQIIQSELSNIDSNTRRMHVDAFYVVNEYLYVHIEINGEFHDWVHYRNYLFFSNIVSGIPRKGQKYKDIDKFIHIDITWGLHSEEEIELEYEIVKKIIKSINI